MAGEIKKQRASWSGKWAFILAAAASAVGLGNMWRFPYLAAKYGGGTFLLTYVVLVFTFGVSLLLLETALGRKTGQSAIGAFKAFGKKYAFIGILASAVPFIITPYYCIIGGWVTKYTAAYLVNGPAALADGGDFFTGFITSNAESYIWMLVFMAIVFVIVGLGVKGGIEKANLFMMPALIIMAVAIAIYTLTMPGAVEGALYYLTPDFSKFSPELVIGALGQMFYSLSLAMGIMITYGSYMRKQDSLTSSVVRIGGFDLGVSFIAGLLIVSAAFVAMGSGDAVAAKAGPSLMFVTLPTVFVDMGGMATIIGFLFFLLVLFAALTSAISLVETLVSIVHDGLPVHARQGPRHRHRVRGHRRSYHQCGLQRAVVHRAARGRFLDPRFRRLHLQLGAHAHRGAAHLRVRRLDREAQDHHRRGAHLQQVLRRQRLDDHDQIHRPGARDHHSGGLRRGSVRLLFHVNRAGQRDFHGEGRPCGRSSLFCGRIVNY